MNTILKFDRVVLVKELNEKFHKIGETFEVANILEDSFLLRDAVTKVAIGVVSFSDFENHFVHEENFKGWTPWTQIIGFDGQNDCMYRTNRRKVQVKFLTDKVRGESCLHKDDKFNLSFGLQMAYFRARNKVIMKRKRAHIDALKVLNNELFDNEKIVEKMINSLGE